VRATKLSANDSSGAIHCRNGKFGQGADVTVTPTGHSTLTHLPKRPSCALRATDSNLKRCPLTERNLIEMKDQMVAFDRANADTSADADTSALT
jgi:hypothetical protein